MFTKISWHSAWNRKSPGIFFLIFTLLIQPTFAEEKKAEAPSSSGSKRESGSRYFLFGGYGLFSGPATTSFAGQKEYSGGLGIEDKRGYLRLFASVQGDAMPESALTLGSATSASTIKYFAFKFAAGFRIFPINLNTRGGMDPFLSAGGTYSRGSVDVSPGTNELDVYFRPNLYGYELCVGVDLKGTRSPVLRPRLCYSNEQGTFSNLSGFALTRTEFQIGICF